MGDPVRLPSARRVNAQAAEFYETNGYVDEHGRVIDYDDPNRPLPVVDDHADDDPDERL